MVGGLGPGPPGPSLHLALGCRTRITNSKGLNVGVELVDGFCCSGGALGVDTRVCFKRGVQPKCGVQNS